MARKQSLTVGVKIDGLDETLVRLRKMPKEANAALKDYAGELAGFLARKIEGAARSDRSAQAKRVASTVKVRRDRLPVIEVGGSTRIASTKVPAYALLFGAEFGSNRFSQFNKRHQGKKGSWFFGTVDDQAQEISEAWTEAADEVVRRFSGGGL